MDRIKWRRDIQNKTVLATPDDGKSLRRREEERDSEMNNVYNALFWWHSI